MSRSFHLLEHHHNFSYYLFKLKKMSDRYVQLSEDLQYSKRETAAYRLKCTQAEMEIEGLKAEVKELKKCVEALQDSNGKLMMANRQLSEDKESIASGYSTEISMIKQEIASKQKEIAELRDVATPAKVDQQIVIRQLKYDLHQEFSSLTAVKDKKIQEISAQIERANYQREIEREKSKLKIQTLEDSLHELQIRYENQLQQYTVRLNQQIQIRPSEDKDYLRRLKRENQQLRKKMELSQVQLTQVLQEKNQVTKDYTKWMNEYKKYISQHEAEAQVYKNQVGRLTELLQEQASKKNELALKDRQREIKRLKNQLQEARDEIIFKEKKISDLQLERVKLLNEIKLGKTERDKAGEVIQETLKQERDRLLRELKEARMAAEKLRSQNTELQDKIYDISKFSMDNRKRWEETARIEEEEHHKRLKRMRSEEAIPTIDRPERPERQQAQNQKGEKGDNVHLNKLQESIAIEKSKVKQVLAKYLQMKQRNAQLQKKLKKANDKIVELLQHKINLGSPKATTKKFQFPTQAEIHHFPHSPTDANNPRKHVTINHPHQHSPSPNKYQAYTMNEIRQRQKDNHAFTTTNFRRDYFSPQDDRLIRIEDQDANECSYYEKSLKLKNGQKFKELKCSNHENE